MSKSARTSILTILDSLPLWKQLVIVILLVHQYCYDYNFFFSATKQINETKICCALPERQATHFTNVYCFVPCHYTKKNVSFTSCFIDDWTQTEYSCISLNALQRSHSFVPMITYSSFSFLQFHEPISCRMLYTYSHKR